MADNNYKKEVADFLRTQHNMPLDASDDDLVSFAEESNPEEFKKLTSLAYGNEPTKEPELPKEGLVSKAFNAIDKKATQYNDSINTLAARGEPVSMLLKAPSDIGNLAVSGLNKAEDMAGDGIIGTALGGLKKGAELLPQTPAQALGLALPVEDLIRPVAKGAGKLVEKAGDLFEKAVSYKLPGGFPLMPGAETFKDAWLSGISAAKNKAQHMAEMTKAVKTAQILSDKLTYAREWVQRGAPDAVAYGTSVKDKINAITQVAKNALAPEANALKTETTGLLGPHPDPQEALNKVKYDGNLEHLAPAIQGIEDDLLGVIKTSPDAATVSTINKYLGKEVLAENPGKKLVTDETGSRFVNRTAKESVEKVYPKADVADLLKDRSRIGKLYVKSLEAGERGTSQSTALLKLQNIIDYEILRRTESVPNIAARIKENRKGWSSFYKEFYGQEALDLRKAKPSAIVKSILDSPEAIDNGFKMVPELMPEVIRSEKEQIMRRMANSEKPDIVLSETLGKNRGKYERLFKPEDVKELQEFSALGQNAKAAKVRADELVEAVSKAVPKNRKVEVTGFQRADDPKNTSEALKKTVGSFGARAGGSTLVFAALTHMISPETTKILTAVGVSPSLFSAAYFAGNRAVRNNLISALHNVSTFGKAASKIDLAILRGVGYKLSGVANGQPTGPKQWYKDTREPNGLPSDQMVPEQDEPSDGESQIPKQLPKVDVKPFLKRKASNKE